MFLDEGLTLAGFWTSVIASGLQTLEVFRLRRFDLVVVDAQLAGFDGIELVRRLRGRSDRTTVNSPRSDAPIVFIAQERTELSAKTASDVGADDTLYAPLELETVAQRLHTLFAQWRDAHPDSPLADEAVLNAADR